jgi:hypothetical protein
MYPIEVIIENVENYIISPIFFGSAIIMFIYAGILFITSAGDPSKITKAKTAVIFAIIGIFIGLLSHIATGFIRFIIGVPV